MAAWGLTGAALLADTRTSRVWRVMRGDEAAVLKVLKPEGADEARGMGLLDWYGGRGAARVLERGEGALLMEWVGEVSLGDVVRGGDDAGAMAVLCDVIGVLHGGRPGGRPGPPEGLETLEDRFGALFESGPSDDAAKAARVAKGLLDSTAQRVALHGDLHHDNILRGVRGWLAIDPKGVWGDAAYEPANAFRNPESAGGVALDAGRIARLAGVIAARLGFDRVRVLGWAAGHCALSMVWNREAGLPVEFDTALLPRLLAAHEGAGGRGN